MRERGVEVFEAETLLAEALADPDARTGSCDHILSEREVGIGAADAGAGVDRRRPPPPTSPTSSSAASPGPTSSQDVGLVWESGDPTAMLLPPLPNFLFQRDPSCWIFDGVTINPMTKPARKPEIDDHGDDLQVPPDVHRPRSSRSGSAASSEDWGSCHVEGGDVQPIGNGTVMIGMGERTTPQAVLVIARELFRGRVGRRRCWRCTCRSRAATCTSTR